MGLNRDFCFFIVMEQIIISNIQIERSITNIMTYGFGTSNASVWAQLPSASIQILVAVILAKGLVERKSGKFIPWILVNAVYCLVTSVTTIAMLFDSSITSQLFQFSGSYAVIYTVMLIISVLEWAVWITVLQYYRHLKIKEIKQKMNVEIQEKTENDENPTEHSVFMQYPKMFDNQPQLRNVQFNQNEKEDTLPLNRLYPVPTAPASEL